MPHQPSELWKVLFDEQTEALGDLCRLALKAQDELQQLQRRSQDECAEIGRRQWEHLNETLDRLIQQWDGPGSVVAMLLRTTVQAWTPVRV